MRPLAEVTFRRMFRLFRFPRILRKIERDVKILVPYFDAFWKVYFCAISGLLRCRKLSPEKLGMAAL